MISTVVINHEPKRYEPPRDKTNKVACAPSEDSDQPGHPPSLIRVFAVRMKKAKVLSYPLSAKRSLWSDWADAQADLSLRWAHMSVCWFCHEAAHMWRIRVFVIQNYILWPLCQTHYLERFLIKAVFYLQTIHQMVCGLTRGVHEDKLTDRSNTSPMIFHRRIQR